MHRSNDGDEPRRTRRQETRWSTQDAAWSDIQPTADSIEGRVYQAIADRPSTCDELEDALGLTHQTCSARVNALMRRGLIVADGRRQTKSGRTARVWVARIPESLFGMVVA